MDVGLVRSHKCFIFDLLNMLTVPREKNLYTEDGYHRSYSANKTVAKKA